MAMRQSRKPTKGAEHIEMAREASTPTSESHVGIQTPHERIAIENDMSLRQAIRKYRRVVYYFLGLTTAMLMWGYDHVLVDSLTAVPGFQHDYGEQYDGKWIIPSQWLASWSAIGPAGSMLGSILGGLIQDSVGRRRGLTIGSVLSACAITIVFFSSRSVSIEGRRALYLLGNLFLGFATGIIKIGTIAYMSENAPTALRGPAMVLFPAFTLLGQLTGASVLFSVQSDTSDRGYLTACGSCWILSVAPFVMSFILPESPAYLLRKKRNEEALRSAERLFGANMAVEEHLDRLRVSLEEEEEMAREVSYTNCFNQANRRRTGIVVFANLMPALFGQTLLGNAGYFNQVTGLDSANSLRMKVVGICLGLVCSFGGIYTVSRFARRDLTIITLIAITILWTGMGISGFWSGAPTAWYTAATMMLVVSVSALGCWATSYTIMGEASSLRLRAKTQAVGGVVQQVTDSIMNFALPYIYNPDAGSLRSKTGFIYTGLGAIAVVVAWLYVPEMKGRTPLEIDRMFALGLPARVFRYWKGENDDSKLQPDESV